MAIQQVNLYLPELRPSQEWLTLPALALCFAGILCIFVVSSVAAAFSLKSLEQQVQSVEAQLTRAQVQVQSIRGKLQPIRSNDLNVQVAYLKAAIRGREQVGKIISGENLGNAEGFSDHFQTLAELSNNNFALQSIRLSEGGQFLELQGTTRNPAEVAVYLQKLQDAPAFSATRFGLLSLASDKTKSATHEFRLGFDSIYEQASLGSVR